MNNDLKELFNKRNREILNNKIRLDIDNNTDSLRLTINNVIMLEMNKLNKSIVKLCQQNNISYDDGEINRVIEEEKKKLEEMVNVNLDSRKEIIDESINKNQDNTTEIIRENTKTMIDNIKNNISKENAINFLPNISNKLKIKSEEELIRLNGLVRLAFTTISMRIENNANTRFINLRNMIEESRQISDEYFKKTGDAIEKISSTKNNKKQNKTVKKKIKKAS